MSLTFTKLFSNITESTVWCEPDRTRLAWICMLAMADQHGRVFASIPGLASRARIPVEDARQAIDTFLSPDRDSRTKVLGGRRITEIDGGWVLVNHEKYRTLRDDEAILASKRKYINERRARERAMRDSVEPVEPVTSTVEKSRPIAEAEAEAEAEALIPIPIPAGLRPATAPASPDSAGNVDLTEHQLNGHAPKTVPDCPHKEILELWAKELPELAQHDPALWPESARAENLRARWRATAKLKGWTTKEDGLAYFAKLFRWCRSSDFLMGRTSGGNSRRPFRFELAWLVNATNWTKVHEGRFNE